MAYDVICVGSTTVDVFLRCAQKQIDYLPQADKEVCFPIGDKILVKERHSEVGGSATNSATSLARLGHKVGIVSKLGDDPYADILKKHFKQEKISFLGTSGEGQTGFSAILSGLRGDRTIFAHKGNNDDIARNDAPKQPHTDWFYFGSMLGKSWDTQCALANYARKNNINILYNTSYYLASKGLNYLKPVLDATTILILNKEEARALVGKKKASEKTLLKTLQEHVPIVVVTCGKQGAYAYNGISFYHCKTKQPKIIDTTGAGDAFASGFLSAVIHNKDLSTALQWGAAQARSVLIAFGSTNNLLTNGKMNRQWRRSSTVKEV